MKVGSPRTAAVVACLICIVAGCGAAGPGGAATPPSPSPSLSVPDLKYRLISNVGPPFFCDPDLYPLAHELTDAQVQERVASLRAQDPGTYAAVLHHLGLGANSLTAQQERAVYQQLKELNALHLTPSSSGYSFEYPLAPTGPPHSTTLVAGQIDHAGTVRIERRAPTQVTCPI
jgi:hypothetical protein